MVQLIKWSSPLLSSKRVKLQTRSINVEWECYSCALQSWIVPGGSEASASGYVVVCCANSCLHQCIPYSDLCFNSVIGSAPTVAGLEPGIELAFLSCLACREIWARNTNGVWFIFHFFFAFFFLGKSCFGKLRRCGDVSMFHCVTLDVGVFTLNQVSNTARKERCKTNQKNTSAFSSFWAEIQQVNLPTCYRVVS